MAKTRSSWLLALAPLATLYGGVARADAPEPAVFIDGEPTEWVDNCPATPGAPAQMMRCLSRRLLPSSVAKSLRPSPFAIPDAAAGIDAGAAIGKCDGKSGGGFNFKTGLGPSNFLA